MTQQHYARPLIWIHWLSVILLLIIMALPAARELLAPSLGGANLFMLHKSLAVILVILTVFRVFLRLHYGRPDTLDPATPIKNKIAHLTHIALYICIFGSFLFGYVMSPSAYAINFLNLFKIPTVDFPEAIRQTAHWFHVTMPAVFVSLIALHAVAAIYHHIIKKDNVLKSMLSSK